MVRRGYKEGKGERMWGVGNEGRMIMGCVGEGVMKNKEGRWKGGYWGVWGRVNRVEDL